MRKKVQFVIIILGSIIWMACDDQNKNVLNVKEYEGPAVEVYDIVSYYSDSAQVKLKLETPVQLEFDNNDKEFPEGIYLEFYDEEGNITNTIVANYCYYKAKDELWKATGDVVVKSIINKEQLNTEELFWDPKKEIIFTEEFVRIESDKEIIMGHGLEADQDFSSYTIKKSTGTITLDE